MLLYTERQSNIKPILWYDKLMEKRDCDEDCEKDKEKDRNKEFEGRKK